MLKRGRDDNVGAGPKKPRHEGSGYRFLVGKTVPGLVIGKGGSRVKHIREESGANVSFKSEPGHEDAIMTISGDAQQTATAIGMIAREIASNNTNQPTKQASTDCRMLIHKGYAGAVLGKRGATITQITTDSGARVRLSNEALPGSTDKTVFLVGEAGQIQSAVELVLTKIAENPLREGTTSVPYTLGAAPTAAAMPAGNFIAPNFGYDAQSMEASYYGMPQAMAPDGSYYPQPQAIGRAGGGHLGMPHPHAPAVGAVEEFVLVVPVKCGGAIIGKGGSTAKAIKQNTACNVSVGEPNSEGNSDVKIRGSPEAITMAIGMIVKACAAEFQGQPQSQQFLQVPSRHGGSIIGKGGQRIRDMNLASGCKISLGEKTAEGTIPVTITGSTLGTQAATYMINSACKAQQAAQGGQTPAGVYPGELTEQQVFIPSSSFSNVVGRGGSTIKGIKQQSGCTISIKDPDASDPDSRVVTIRGSPAGIQHAITLITQHL